MHKTARDHYDTLGLDRNCSIEDIRNAYRMLAKVHHPDVNTSSPDAMAQIQAINDAYHILGNNERRQAYDASRELTEKQTARTGARPVINIKQDIHLGLQEFLRGTELEVAVRDPAHPAGTESYHLVVPPETAPGTRFRIKRAAPFDNGSVMVRAQARPDRYFKRKGSDVRCDLRINARRATTGGTESVRGITGNYLQVTIPPKVARGEIIRIDGEGLPKPRGGRGDLLVKITYRPEVSITRKSASSTSSFKSRRLLK